MVPWTGVPLAYPQGHPWFSATHNDRTRVLGGDGDEKGHR